MPRSKAVDDDSDRPVPRFDRIERWVKATGFVNVAPDFNSMPAVVNGFSELVLEVWGPDAGAHARSAIGVAALPFDWPVEVEASVAIRG